MKKYILIGAGSDLGVHIDGARSGPKVILNKLNKENILILLDENIKKSQDIID